MTTKGSLQMSIPIVKAFRADIWSKIWLGHVTCKQGVVSDFIFEFPDPICLSTIQLSWGYDDDQG